MASGNAASGFGKDPLMPCHGDSLVDQSFQSLKSKEIRDSMSPTMDMKFHSMSLNQPNTTGWDVQTSSEVSPDGRSFRTDTVAKTDEHSTVHTETGGKLNLRAKPLTDSVAARRNIFENGSSTTPKSKQQPSETGRRPSYMDHTVCSLEHIRRDSLEINKNNYSRKPAADDELNYESRPNTAVKFDVPQRQSSPRKEPSISEELNIEEIFDLEILEEMLETVTSYELRRRIRAQIRLIKKNMLNTSKTESQQTQLQSSSSKKVTVSSSTQKSSYTSRTTKELQEIEVVDKPQAEPQPGNQRIVVKETDWVIEDDIEQKPARKQPQQTSKRQQSPERKSPVRKPLSTRQTSPEASPSRQRSVSPDAKSKTTRQQETSQRSSISSKISSNRQTSPSRKPTAVKESPKTPIWADRKNILKTPTNQSPLPTRKTPTASSSTSSRITSSSTHSVKKTSSSSMQQSKTMEEDCITSSYGIGPTDENGLPLFGIRALKKKKPSVDMPCESKEEVTGYVVEESMYTDSNSSKPIVQRKELVYSTNDDDLNAIKTKLEQTRGSFENVEGTLETSYQKLPKATQPETRAIKSSHDDIPASTYVRRGSVKEMSDKFIRKESEQSVSQKSSSQSYPKAGLIYRTNSRNGSMDAGDCFETSESYNRKTASDYQISQDVEESESECESVSVKSISKQTSSAMSTSSRSFLNTTQETKTVTGIDDVLERMRNADNVVEEGDSAEDQEARALLNKFLGASVIMSGVETMMPTTRQTKTFTYTSNDDDGNEHGDDNAHRKQAVKTTRITTTTTTKSGSSSSPVTRATCDIEEIWDEAILKQLLEQSTTYEERRKIRARLRELMAEREALKQSSSAASSTHTTRETTASQQKDGAVVTTTTKVTTRTVSGKPQSPFAKFKQLDKQNSLQSPKTSK